MWEETQERIHASTWVRLSTTRFTKLNCRLLGFGASLSHWFRNFHIHQLLLLPTHSTNLSPTGSVGMQQLLHCKSHLTTIIWPMESANFMNSSRRMVNTHTHTKQELAAASQPCRKRKFALAPIKFSTIHSKQNLSEQNKIAWTRTKLSKKSFTVISTH